MTKRRAGKILAFPKTRRLNSSSEFQKVKADGRVERGRLLMLGVLKTNDPVRFRAGFITSGAIGRAVSRNRVRRLLREIVRRHQNEIGDGFWLVTIARASAANAAYAELEAEWLRLAARTSILAA